jgi:hypothetical protein
VGGKRIGEDLVSLVLTTENTSPEPEPQGIKGEGIWPDGFPSQTHRARLSRFSTVYEKLTKCAILRIIVVILHDYARAGQSCQRTEDRELTTEKRLFSSAKRLAFICLSSSVI